MAPDEHVAKRREKALKDAKTKFSAWMREHLDELKREGRTQTALADILQTTQATVSRWKTGAAWPAGDSLVLLAEFLGYSIDRMFGLPLRLTPPKETTSDEAYVIVMEFLGCVRDTGKRESIWRILNNEFGPPPSEDLVDATDRTAPTLPPETGATRPVAHRRLPKKSVRGG